MDHLQQTPIPAANKGIPTTFKLGALTNNNWNMTVPQAGNEFLTPNAPAENRQVKYVVSNFSYKTQLRKFSRPPALPSLREIPEDTNTKVVYRYEIPATENREQEDKAECGR